ncbi:hypothetical protein Btru_063708 [Bulinus truncatus]|nr:hypothetical protein Btru_063708 [Bulinus truncatus]
MEMFSYDCLVFSLSLSGDSGPGESSARGELCVTMTSKTVSSVLFTTIRPVTHIRLESRILASTANTVSNFGLLNVREVLTARRGQHAVSSMGNNSINTSDASRDMSGVFPVAELLVALGFLFIYITDTIIKAWQYTKKVKTFSDSNENVLFQRFPKAQSKPDRPFKWSKPRFSVDEMDLTVSDNENHNVGGSGSVLDEATMDSPLGALVFSEEEHPLAHGDKLSSLETSNQLRSVALVAALAIHGFFDGVMLGLQTSERVILSVLFALSIHKSFVAVGLSLTLLHNYDKSVKSSRIFLYVFIFATVAPAGLAMSAAFVHSAFDLSDQSAGASIIPGCLQAFAVGTFIYVAFTETVRRETRRSVQSEACGHVFLLVGFILMAGLRAILGNE